MTESEIRGKETFLILGDAKFFSVLDEAAKKKAKEELKELNDRDREIAVQTFRQWALDEDWLKTPTGNTEIPKRGAKNT